MKYFLFGKGDFLRVYWVPFKGEVLYNHSPDRPALLIKVVQGLRHALAQAIFFHSSAVGSSFDGSETSWSNIVMTYNLYPLYKIIL